MGELWQKGRWLIVGALVVVGGGVALSLLRPTPLPAHPLALAPEGAQIVARIDVPALMRSHLWQVLLEEDEDAEVRGVERTCGFDPLEEVEQAVVFATGADARPFEHVGFVARGEVARGRAQRERLVGCVREVVGARGGGGGVRETEVEGVPALASRHGSSLAAFAGEDGVVGGDALVVGATLRAVQGRGPSAAADAELMALWEDVSPDRDVVAVARLPESWTPALRRMAGSLEGGLGTLLSVRTLAVGVRVRDGLGVTISARTARPSEARGIEEALSEQIEATLADRVARLSVLGGVLRGVEVEAEGREVRISGAMSDGQLDGALELWRELREAGQEEPEPESPTEPEPGAEPVAAEPESPTEAARAPEAQGSEAGAEPGRTPARGVAAEEP